MMLIFDRKMYCTAILRFFALFALCAGTPSVQAATDSFNGGAVAGCTISGVTYTCTTFALGAADVVSIASGYTVKINAGQTFGYNNGLTMSGTAVLSITGNLDISGINPANLQVSGGTLSASGSFSVGAQAQTLTANITAASMIIGTGSVVNITGNLTSTGAIAIASNVTVIGNISGTTITTNTPDTLNGNITATTSFTLASGSSVSGSVIAPTVTMQSSNATIGGSVTAANVTLGYHDTVAQTIYCTGGDPSDTCSCVTNNSGYAVGATNGPQCASQAAAWYHMDEAPWTGAAGQVIDSSGNGNNAQAINGATTQSTNPSPAIPGTTGTCNYGAMYFSGVNHGYVLTPITPPTANFTMAAWIYSTNASANAQRIFYADKFYTNGYAFSLGDVGTSNLRVYNRAVNPVYLDSTYTISSNTWYFIAATINTSTKTRTIYVYSATGALLNTTSGTYTGTWGSDGGPLVIGAEINGATEAQNFTFQGYIDEAQIFPEVLSQSATAALATQTHVCGTSGGSTAAGFNVVDGFYASGSYTSAANHDIFTKLAGTGFSLGVVALNSSGATQTGYVGTGQTKNVTLQLIDDSSGTSCNSSAAACSVCSKTIVATVSPVTFGPSDAGYHIATIPAISNAYSRLIARVIDSNSSPTVYACSSDAFAIRPPSFTLSATTSGGTTLATSTPAASAPTATPTVKAGAAFTITAVSGTPGYGVSGTVSGTPGFTISGGTIVNATDYVSQQALPSTMLTGAFSAANTTTGTATGTSFTYNDVGYFVFAANAVADNTWTTVDQSSGDCNAGSYSNTIDANGKYGCGIGSSALSGGRFTPDHFVLSASSVVNRSDLVNTVTPLVNGGIGPNPASSFTYLGEPLQVQFTLIAVNAAGSATNNYLNSATLGNFSKFTSATQLGVGTTSNGIGPNSLGLWGIGNLPIGTGACNAVFAHVPTSGSYPTTFVGCTGGAVAPTTPIGCSTLGSNCTSVNARITAPGPTFTAFANGISTFTANMTIARADTTDGPYQTFSIGAAPTDADGITLSTTLNLDTENQGANQRLLLGTSSLLYGRLKLGNANGTELLPLWVPATAQYISGFSSAGASGLVGPIFTTNVNDNATTFLPQSVASLAYSAGSLTSSNFTVTGNIGASLYGTTTGTTTKSLISGVANIKVTPPSGSPTPTGSAYLALTLGTTNANQNCVVPATTLAGAGASLTYLQWAGWCANKLDPNAQVTFGTGKNRFIYLRENY